MADDSNNTYLNGALSGVRVLDLTAVRGNFGAKLIAGLGADVIKFEPPAGDELRHIGPFASGHEGPEASLTFAVNNINKRGVTLDFESSEGQLLFRRLAATSDIVLETADPGWMDERGIGFKMLSALNPRLIYTAITPYGQTGPYARYKGSEISGQAMGGAMFMTGTPGARPVRASWLVSDKMSGYTAAAATMFALYHQRTTGRGQYIDVSTQEAVAAQMESAPVLYWFAKTIRQRNGWRYPSTTCPAGIYPTKDGYASIVASKPHQWTGLRDWINDERLMEERYMIEANRFAERDYIDPIVTEWTKTMLKAELFHEGQRRGVPIGESMTPADIVHDVHLLQRGYIVSGEHPELGEFQMPGAPFQMSGTPWRLRRSAPLLGEHNAEVYAEIGVTPAELTDLKTRKVI
ncbi:MAG: CoA transferase [Tepidiformaceae bacterium]